MTPEGSPANPSAAHPKRVYSSQSDGDLDLSTIPDPRSRAMSPASGDGTATPSHHPDLDDEVATLSTKLINAINHQTSLDDTLSETRLELERSRQQVKQLEAQIAAQQEVLAGDVWVRRKSVDAEKSKLLSRLTQEKKARESIELEKRKIEQELENLTAALFEEANKMVISAKEEARKEQEAIQRKNDQLKSQLSDTELLLKSQQEQLAELKQVMEQMTVEQDEGTALTAPSSPGLGRYETGEEESPTSDGSSQSGVMDAVPASYPTSFTHLLQPVLRTDLASYEDFVSLIRFARKPSSRPPSGTHSGFGALGMGPVAGASAPASNASTTSVSTTGTISAAGSPQTPNTPASALSTGSIPSVGQLTPLKDTKFYKRVLAEDVEPTLRLDTAPGLSWLARRSVVAAMTDGSLVVEPVPTTGSLVAITKPQFFPCSLCGESRKDAQHLRTHRFRTSENGSAQRYPLCAYCLGRVRSTCDFLGFLRIVKDGHWRAEGEDAEKAAWEESVRLREQMFWSRIGGGVVPVNPAAAHGSIGEKSPRPSHDEPRVPVRDLDALVEEKDGVTPAEEVEDFATPFEEKPAEEKPAEEKSAEEKSADVATTPAHDPLPAVETPSEDGPEPAAEPAAETSPASNRNSTQSLSPDAKKETPKRLSIEIPGSS
jgi:chemotaxis protein histidine kinase CheA